MYVTLRRFPESTAEFFEVSHQPDSLYRLLWQVSPAGLTDCFGHCFSLPTLFHTLLQHNMPVMASEAMHLWVQETLLATFVKRVDQIVTHLSVLPESAFTMLHETEEVLTTLLAEARRLRFLDGPNPILYGSTTWAPPTDLNHPSQRVVSLLLKAGPDQQSVGVWIITQDARGRGWINLEHDQQELVPIPRELYAEIDALPWSLVGKGGGDREETLPTPAPVPVPCSDMLRDWCLDTLIWEELPDLQLPGIDEY